MMNILAKPEIENCILIDELVQIMENFGIVENKPGVNIATMGVDIIHEAENEQTHDSNTHLSRSRLPDSPQSNIMNDEDELKLTDHGLAVLYLMTEYLLRSGMSLYNVLQGKIYEQLVKSGDNQAVVEIVPSEDFFNMFTTHHIVPDGYLEKDDGGKTVQE